MSRIFLIGSGPSLRNTPLNDLAQEHTMVMNKFGRIAAELGVHIKPTYYFKQDHNTIDLTHKEEIQWGLDNCSHLFLWERFRDGYKPNHPNYDIMPSGVGDIPRTTWFPKCPDAAYQWDNYRRTQSWHLPTLCTAFGGMSTMIQIAVTLGYSEIYLLGCDLGYTPDVNQNHAINDYTKDRRDKSAMDNGNMLALHEMAARCSPIPIYNATVGGHLEVYPRADIHQILKGYDHAESRTDRSRGTGHSRRSKKMRA